MLTFADSTTTGVPGSVIDGVELALKSNIAYGPLNADGGGQGGIVWQLSRIGGVQPFVLG
jgi:hypothetical protein